MAGFGVVSVRFSRAGAGAAMRSRRGAAGIALLAGGVTSTLRGNHDDGPHQAALLQIANAMQQCFDWRTSPEGPEFWKAVANHFHAWSKAEHPRTPLAGASAMQHTIALQAERIEKLEAEVKALRRQLLIADFTGVPARLAAPHAYRTVGLLRLSRPLICLRSGTCPTG